jgi:hypothetical protein
VNATTTYRTAPAGAVSNMKEALARKIVLLSGWRPPGAVEWEGTVEEFWAANEETTWGDIRRMIDDIEVEGESLQGGGAQPLVTVRYAKES